MTSQYSRGDIQNLRIIIHYATCVVLSRFVVTVAGACFSYISYPTQVSVNFTLVYYEYLQRLNILYDKVHDSYCLSRIAQLSLANYDG